MFDSRCYTIVCKVSLTEEEYKSARWFRSGDDGSWELVPNEDQETIPWIPSIVDSFSTLDPPAPDFPLFEEFPRLKHARFLSVSLESGDLLYLPALWYHRVSQTGNPYAIAINFWYDMNFASPLYTLNQLVRKLTLMVDKGQSGAKVDQAEDKDEDHA